MIGGVILFVVVTASGSYGDSPAASMIMTPNMAACQSVGAKIKEDIVRQRPGWSRYMITFTCQDIRP